MLDVLNYFKKKFPSAEFYLILGADSYQDIENWHQYKKVLENPIIVVTRDNENDLKKRDGVSFIYSKDKSNISSTLIREALSGIEACTLRYIIYNNLYKKEV